VTPAKASVSRMLDFEMPIREQPGSTPAIETSEPNFRKGSTPTIENSEANLRKGWEADIPAPFDYRK
jgi:hypothetical protein